MPRIRSARAHTQALDAAAELFATHGIDGASMDSIAASSGVSKATLYKHWKDKDALCLEVLMRLHGMDEAPPPQTEDSRADIVALLRQRAPAETAGLRARLMPHFVAYAARNPEFGKAWRMRTIHPHRLQLIQALQRAVQAGDLRRDLDYEVAVAMLAGPMAYRYMIAMAGHTLPDDMADQVVAAFWRAHQPEA